LFDIFQNRAKLMENPLNKQSLATVEEAITVFSFDDEKPSVSIVFIS